MIFTIVLFLSTIAGVIMKSKHSASNDLVKSSVDQILEQLFDSDKIDKIAATIAERAAQKFNELQKQSAPVLRSIDKNIENFGRRSSKKVRDRKSKASNKSKVLTKLIHDFITPRSSLPLKNLYIKYKVGSENELATTVAAYVKNQKESHEPLISIGDILQFNSKASSEVDKSIKEHVESTILSTVTTEITEIKDEITEIKDDDPKEEKEKPADNSERKANAKIDIFNPEDTDTKNKSSSIVREEVLGEKTKATRKEDNKIFTFQSSEDYAEYHQQLAEVRRSKGSKA